MHGNSIKITVHWWLRKRDSNPRTAFERYTISNYSLFDYIVVALGSYFFLHHMLYY